MCQLHGVHYQINVFPDNTFLNYMADNMQTTTFIVIEI